MFFLQLRLQTKKCKVSWLIMGLENRCMAMTQKHTQLETQLEAECSEANNLIQQTFKGKFRYFLFSV